MEKIKIAEEWWKKASQNNKNRYKIFYDGLPFKVVKPILEIGGGNGSFLDYMDIDEATIFDIAGEESLKREGYKFITRDITKQIFSSPKFKTIFVMETLEHIKNPLYLMAQVYNILDDDGNCYIAVPYTPLDLERKNQENPYNCHVCRWKKKELIDQMEKLGFEVKVIKQRRRFKNTAFWLPHCWLVLELKKRLEH